MSTLIGAVTVFSHRSIRISYHDSRNRMTVEIAKGIRRDGTKAAARPNMIPPARERITIHCSSYMRVFLAEPNLAGNL